MSTPLYKKLKSNGSTFFCFPSSSMHTKPKFSKFVLLNIPNKIEDKRLDFEQENLDMNSHTFEIYADHASSDSSYAAQMVESLRNYVANHDETMRNSKISSTKDFYNIKEKQTPTEIIFWKWLKKMNAVDFEVARHKIDWNKNNTDFDNSNADILTNTDYFRKYLWKEREVISYSIETIVGVGNDTVQIYISHSSSFKIDDKVKFSGDYDSIVENTEYKVGAVDYSSTSTKLTITVPNFTMSENPDGNPNINVKLSYDRLVQYIGEINVQSDVQTSRKDETEISIYIPHQAGRTPSVLFETRFDENYYPGLELPILPEQIQTEILGAEDLNSPIRINPSNYSGLYYGQFDTVNKTYAAKTGDKFRYSGNYFGVNRSNNIGLSADNYFETPIEFDSSNLDGLNIDFNLEHYYKMSLTSKSVGFNFDEFNQIVIDGINPQSFEYNAILWYYDVDGDIVNDTNTYTNLYGITFLNNPDSNINVEINKPKIETYKKLVSSDEYDGLSYIHTLNIMTSVDNDIASLKFDPLTINNNYGFEIYQNVMTNVAKLNESYVNIINQFITMNTELNNMKSLIYTQTDYDTIMSKLKNMDSLLKLYSKNQFIDSDTVSLETNYSGTYPTIAFNVKQSEYSSVYNFTTKDIYSETIKTGTGYQISVPDSNKLFVKITNNDITNQGSYAVYLNNDLKYKQSAEFLIDANQAFYTNTLSVYMNYYNSNVGYTQNTLLFDSILPTDIGNYLSENITYNRVYYNNCTIKENINLIDAKGSTTVPYTLMYSDSQNCFGNNDYEERVYIDNFKFKDSNNKIIDKSGMYKIGKTENDFNEAYFRISLDTFDLTLVSNPIAYLIKNIKINILRIDSTDTSSISDRYLIQKTYL